MAPGKASTVFLLVFLVLLSSFAASYTLSSGETLEKAQDQADRSEVEQKTAAPNSTGPPGDSQPELPEQASPKARGVLDRVFGGIGNAFNTMGGALRDFLGG